MGITVARLRLGLVVGVTILAVVISGFLGYARYRTHRFLAGLPAKLGMDIRRETNGYTYSQSVGGKTVMTLHAAKAVERSNGKVTLHDVSMVLYGRKQDRADQISGGEFEYDQASGVVRAVGEVHIDLQAPAAAMRGKPGGAAGMEHGSETEANIGRAVHVKTSGLVYLQKLGVAATDQDLEFRFGDMTGHAKGAEYNSDTGVVTLQAAVKANGIQHGTPVVLTAAHAELNRQSQVALLTEARYSSPGQTASGDHAMVHLRSDGSPERIEAEGNVSLSSPGRGTMRAPHADLLLSAAGQAQGAHLFGGVRYVETSSLREGSGEAEDERVSFNAAGQPEKAVLTGAVHIKERVRGPQAGATWSTREATAGVMTVLLAGEAGGKRRVARSAEANSSARLILVSEEGTKFETRSEMTGDRLSGEFTEGKVVQLTKLHGAGHTSVRRLNAQGAEQTSQGDTLEVLLKPGAKHSEEIARAVQTGHVVLTSKAAAKIGAGTPLVQRATAELAVYEGESDHLTLTGHAQVVDESGTVAAGRIVLEHGSGDAKAEGTVKATYLQASTDAARNAEPVHVLADHAELRHEAQRAIFYAAAGGRPARLWQGASQVEAPVLDFERQAGRLTAHGETTGGSPPVHAVLVGLQAGGKPGPPSVARIGSRTMVYLEASRQVDFNGAVLVEDAGGTLRANEATAYLQRDESKEGAAASKVEAGQFPGGTVDRIVAKGKIEIEQPGRRAAGEQLVYTASDGMFVLTGTAAAPPQLVDEAQGTITGTSLRFQSGDRSVMVTGGDAANASQRVHTVTRVKPR